MKRKVIQIADSTQLISLPRKWAQQYNIKKGDELEITEYGNKLSIATELKQERQEIDIDVTDLDRSSILHTIRSLYRRGFDSIRVSFKKQMAPHYRCEDEKRIISLLHEEVNRLPGIDIVQQKSDFCVITSLSTLNQQEFDSVLRRIFILLTDTSRDFLQAIENNDQILLQTIEEKHFSITKFVSYCCRLLNKIGHPEQKNQALAYHIIATIYNISAVLKYAARDAHEYGKEFSKESKKIVKSVNDSLLLYHEFFYKYSFEKITELSMNKESIKKAVRTLSAKTPVKETIILSNLTQTLELVLDITSARTSLEY